MLFAAILAAGPGAMASPPDGGRLDLDLSDREVAKIVPPATPPGAILRPPRSSLVEPAPLVLEPSPDGGYLYRGAMFDARIAADGSVTYSNKDLSIERAAGGPAITGRDPFGSHDAGRAGGGPALRFDLTNEYLRRLHKDPARDAKAVFLTRTFDLRMKLAMNARSELRQAALDNLPVELQRLWHDRHFTTSERERLLYAAFEGFPVETADGAAARKIVRDFARRHLPPKKLADYR
jgi:hypothetical protein